MTRSVTSTVYVSAVNCRHVRAGRYEGQRNGAELYETYVRGGNLVHPFDFAGYYSYCHGHSPHYAAEFLVSEPGAGLLTFRRAGFRVAPGDPLRISIVVRGAHVTLSITDVNTHRHARTTGPSLGLRTGWLAGVLPMFGSQTGRPMLTGSRALVEQYSPTGGPSTDLGPAPFAPVVFRTFKLGGRRLAYRHGQIFSSFWHGSTGERARVTQPRNGAFIVIEHVKPPKLGRTVDVAPVYGTSLIEGPGGHSFHKLGQGQQIPNGSTIDTSQGEVQLTLGLPDGKSETGVFHSGKFKLRQDDRTGATTATLLGGGKCSPPTPGDANPAAASAARATATEAKAKGKGKGKSKGNGKKLQSLWANAHGDFTTKGSAGAASVLGTEWFTENTCAGTYFKVVRDKIRVTVYYPHVHTVVVTQGHSLFAPNKVVPIKFVPIIKVSPVTTTDGRFNVHVTDTYRLTVISHGHPSYVDAAVAPNLPGNGTTPLFADGSVNGVPRWYVLFNITPNLIDFQYWNIGVRIGSKMYLVRLRVHG